MTDRLRIAFALLFGATVVVALTGWLCGLDPSAVAPVVGWAAAACGVGEASNVGKRATFNPEALERTA